MEFKIRPDGATRTFRVLKTVDDISSTLGDLWYEYPQSFKTVEKAQDFINEKVKIIREERHQAQLDREWEDEQKRNRYLLTKV